MSSFRPRSREAVSRSPTTEVAILSNSRISTLFRATVEATEEAIINALIAAETMVGRRRQPIRSRSSHDRLRELLRTYNRLSD